MKVTMVMVMTLDGKITRDDETDVTKWTSYEDQFYFSSLVKKNKLIVIGSSTYEAIKKTIRLHKGKLRIVLTRNIKKYKSKTIAGQLEFSRETPKQLVKRLEKKYSKMLLLGGGIINGLFLKDNLVDELYLTLEPKIFGRGKLIVGDQSLNSRFSLFSIKKLNQRGTLLLKYRLI